MSQEHLLDADVVIDYLRGVPRAVALLDSVWDRVVLPAVVVAELFEGARGAREMATLDALVAAIGVVPITAEIARDAGLLRSQYRVSHGVGLGDALVAATARVRGLAVLTLNTRHYPMFAALTPAYQKP